MLKPLLARGKLQLIGATTFDEYQKYIEKDPALKRRFQDLHVDEPDPASTVKILQGLQ
jgi:ATP-dependent Clp protease ATP-binding subunit ClpA